MYGLWCVVMCVCVRGGVGQWGLGWAVGGWGRGLDRDNFKFMVLMHSLLPSIIAIQCL